jgi:hypothetical protein
MAFTKNNRFFALVLGAALVVLSGACSGGGSNNNGDDDDDVPNMCAENCAAPNMCCSLAAGTFCLAVSSDKNNCGGCGQACDPNTSNSCASGQCRCNIGPACGNGSACCGDGCKDLQNDPQNCGACGKNCGVGATCTAGQCTCGGLVCGANQSCCGGTCVDTMVDEQNCGMCGTTCSGMLDTCNNGTCGCASGGGACPPMPVAPMCCSTGCVDVSGDVLNCGTCDRKCGGVFPICFLGNCAFEPPPDAGVPDAPLPDAPLPDAMM